MAITLKYHPTQLIERSLQILLENQSTSGAFIASPNFSTYAFCWFRDSSYIAYALDLYGKHEAAAHFHAWAASTINHRADRVQRALQKALAGEALNDSDVLHTRYALDGEENTTTTWENFQLDGFGTWLWALAQHQKLTNHPIPFEWLNAAQVTADYIEGLWNHPCYDCWEEFPDHVHPHTLAAIYGGLQAHMELTGRDHRSVTEAIRSQLLIGTETFDHFVKFPASPEVDASLLGLAVPYGVVKPDDPLMIKTVQQIEATILRDGGLHRYAADTYYGGGAWILLSAWLSWYYVELANVKPDLAPSLRSKIETCRRWIESRVTKNLELPEQVAENLNFPEYYPIWIERWGKIASPLLWSHANYIIMIAKQSS